MILNRQSSVVQSRVATSNSPIQQIKVAGLTSRTTNTQGLPQPVSNVSVAVIKSGANRTLRISFTENPSDPYFTSAQLYITQGNGNPTLLASGTSPIVVTLPANKTPAIVTVVSNGNWGSTPLDQSPGKAVSLA
jgi:hypothetical protein